ncbi:MAG: hypothetical protein ACW99G_24540 [Candidatus Thorarchaeota archaeon]|jgi:hypothetical protein
MRFKYTGTDWLAFARFRYYMHLATKASSIAMMDYWLQVAHTTTIK